MTCTTHHICDCKAKKLDEALQQIEKLKGALEFYQRPMSWEYNYTDGIENCIDESDLEVPPDLCNPRGGKRARAALAELEKWERGEL